MDRRLEVNAYRGAGSLVKGLILRGDGDSTLRFFTEWAHLADSVYELQCLSDVPLENFFLERAEDF